MNVIPLLLKEFEQEGTVTRKMLKLVPAEKFEWAPHEKSMKLQVLSVHIAELPSWVKMALNTSELDFAKMDYKPTPVNNNEELMQVFETSFNDGKNALSMAREEDLLPDWTMRSGDQIFSVMTKYEVIRHSLAQTIHHRAQLGVYLRLLNVPLPGSYGPSADENTFG